jgi:hypothetical protein
MKSPTTPPLIATGSIASNTTSSIPLHSKRKTVDWLKAAIQKVEVCEGGHRVRLELMRRKIGLPKGVVQNEVCLADFVIETNEAPNVVFDAELLNHLDRQNLHTTKTSCNRLAIALGMLAEVKVETNEAGYQAYATLVFATYGGGYYLHRSSELVFSDAASTNPT